MVDHTLAAVLGLHAIVLAAGRASRYGSPKLLAQIDGSPMLARTVRTAGAVAGRNSVTVVLGAGAEQLEALVRAESAAAAFNPHFDDGISSSIRIGVTSVPAGTRAVMILLADQIAVTADDLRRLTTRWTQQPDRIAAASYGGTTGAPAIFPSDLFPQLAALRGDRGARTVLADYSDRVVAVHMPNAAIDVDRPTDLAARTPMKASSESIQPVRTAAQDHTDPTTGTSDTSDTSDAGPDRSDHRHL